MYKGNNMDIPHSDSIPAAGPLSEVQLGIYLECVGKPDNTLYNVPVMLDIPQGTDKLRLYDAIKTVFEKHKILYKEKQIESKEKGVCPWCGEAMDYSVSPYV